MGEGDFMELGKIKSKLPELIRNKRLLELIILPILIIIMLIVFIPLFFTKETVATRMRPVTCKNCKKRDAVNIGNIEDCKCPLCNGEIQYTYKCLECDFEFPLRRLKRDEISGIKNMTAKEYVEYRISESRCPNCGSIYTDPKKITDQK